MEGESHTKELHRQLQIKLLGKDSGLYYSKALKLGSGAYGEVFIGYDETKHRPFAVKIVELSKIKKQYNSEQLLSKLKDEIINMTIIKSSPTTPESPVPIVEFYDAK